MPRIIRRLTLLCTLALILPVILLACGSDAPSATPASDEARPTPKTPLANTSPETDREALVALYNATDGPNWANNENWLSGAPIGEWYGVRTDDNGRVTWLFLYENRLSGEIPAELGNLANLENLRFGRDQLMRGCVPTSLQDQLFNPAGPPFCASVPETDREALVALYNATDGPNWANENYWLSGASIGEWYGVTTDDNGRVTWLWLHGNQLSGEIPPELGNLANLTQMALSGSELSGAIPSELSTLSNLESLVLSDNELRGCVPSSLQDRLIMAFSDLGGLPFCGAEPAPTTIELA